MQRTIKTAWKVVLHWSSLWMFTFVIMMMIIIITIIIIMMISFIFIFYKPSSYFPCTNLENLKLKTKYTGWSLKSALFSIWSQYHTGRLFNTLYENIFSRTCKRLQTTLTILILESQNQTCTGWSKKVPYFLPDLNIPRKFFQRLVRD